MIIQIKNIVYNFAPKSVDIKIGDTYGNMIKDEKDNVIDVIKGIALDQKSCDFHNQSENTRLIFNIQHIN